MATLTKYNKSYVSKLLRNKVILLRMCHKGAEILNDHNFRCLNSIFNYLNIVVLELILNIITVYMSVM